VSTRSPATYPAGDRDDGKGSAVAKLEIRIFGDPVLRQRAHEVDDFDGRLVRLADDMFETMRAAQGVGLAANQVGVLKRMFTWEVEREQVDEGTAAVDGGAVVNPVIEDASGELASDDEGCLSLPGLFYPVERPLWVEVGYQDLAGERHLATLRDFHARVWLHEMDHLDGILFVDHLALHDRQEALRRLREDQLDGDAAAGAAGRSRGAGGGTNLLLGRAPGRRGALRGQES